MSAEKLDVQELVEQGKVLYSLDKYDEALDLLRKAEEIDPYYEPVYENLSACYIMVDKYDEAREALNRYLMLNKKSGLANFHLGNIALLEGNVAEAKAFYSKAELLGFNNPVMYMNLASFYEEEEDYDKASEQYNKVLRISPYDYSVMEKKTQMLMRAGRFEEALKSAKNMVTTDIDKYEGHHYVYVALIMMKNFDDAKKYIEDVIARFPDNITAKFDRIRLYDLTGEAQLALSLLEKDFPLFAELPHVATLKMGLLLQLQRADEAIKLVETTDALRKNVDVLTMMYSLYFAKENYEKALEYCEAIQRLGESSSQFYATWYFRPLAEQKLGKNEVANMHFEEAVEKLKPICIKNPTKIDLYMYRALCEYQLGKIADAQKSIEYLLAVKSDYAAFHQVAAVIYDAAGETSDAEKHRAIAKEIDPDIAIPLI